MEENAIRMPWIIEQSLRWPGLFTVYDCDGNVIAGDKIKEVAELIAAAPETKRLLDEMIQTAEDNEPDAWENDWDMGSDDPGETFLDYGRPGAGDIEPWQEGGCYGEPE